jgi:hypothetical protein
MRRTIALTTAALVVGSGGAAMALAGSGGNGHTNAVAEDKTMLADAPTLSAAVSTSTAPVKRLAGAPERPLLRGLVTRRKYWTVGESSKPAYSDLTATTPSGFVADGTGSERGPAHDDIVRWTSYRLVDPPAGIAVGNLLVAVTPTGKSTSAIGVYALAAPQPKRPADETVPTPVHAVVVSRVPNAPGKHVVQRTLTGSRAEALVAAFNTLTVNIDGPIPCPAMPPTGHTDSATFRSGGNVWTASPSCPGIAVVRDGKRLSELNDSTRFERDLARALRIHHHKRPKAEHVPMSLRTVHLARRNNLIGPVSKRRTVTDGSARTLVRDFDRLRVVPPDSVHCNVVGGPETIVRFRTKAHTWVVTESACTNVVVTRDRKRLATLIGSRAWEKAVRHDLSH